MGGAELGGMNGTAMLPGVGTVVGIILGGVLGGSAGSIIGNLLGSFTGEKIGALIVKYIKCDDRAVKAITDLDHGDQIVLYCKLPHPRHHAIVMRHDGKSKVCVIHNTYQHGVVEEWVEFVLPVYKVVYNKQAKVEDTERKARSKIGGKNEYNLLTYNCKHFAEWCKKI